MLPPAISNVALENPGHCGEPRKVTKLLGLTDALHRGDSLHLVLRLWLDALQPAPRSMHRARHESAEEYDTFTRFFGDTSASQVVNHA